MKLKDSIVTGFEGPIPVMGIWVNSQCEAEMQGPHQEGWANVLPDARALRQSQQRLAHVALQAPRVKGGSVRRLPEGQEVIDPMRQASAVACQGASRSAREIHAALSPRRRSTRPDEQARRFRCRQHQTSRDEAAALRKSSGRRTSSPPRQRRKGLWGGQLAVFGGGETDRTCEQQWFRRIVRGKKTYSP